MDKSKIKELPITFTVNSYHDTEDTRFLNVTIDILHTGLNYNGSIFTKEVVNQNLDSLKNTPILGYIEVAEGDGNVDDFKAHEYKIVKDKNGTYKYVYSGHAYGVLPESCNPRWITKVSSDGVVREYLQADGLLWTKFDKSIEIFARDKIKGQSMELEEDSIEGTENPDGTFTFSAFKFDGCCILSTTDEKIQPAMIDSKIVANFSSDTIASEIKEKLNEYQTAISFDNKYFIKREENRLDESKKKLLDKYEVSVDELDFNIDNLSVEDLESKLKDYINIKNSKQKNNFMATYGEKRKALQNALDSIVTRNDNGEVIECVNFYVMDFDDKYVYVERNYWNDSGDYETKYGRFSYTYDEQNMTAEITSDFEEMFLVWLTAEEKAEHDAKEQEYSNLNENYNKLQKEFNNYKEKYKTEETEVEKLREFKNKTLEKERQDAINAIFARPEFESITNNDEFINLKNNVGNMSLEDIEEKCFAILGKSKTNFTTQTKNTVKVSIPVSDDSAKELYGGLFEKYKDCE